MAVGNHGKRLSKTRKLSSLEQELARLSTRNSCKTTKKTCLVRKNNQNRSQTSHFELERKMDRPPPLLIKHVTNKDKKSRSDSRMSQRNYENLEYITVALSGDGEQTTVKYSKNVKLQNWLTNEDPRPIFRGRNSQGNLRKISQPALTVDIDMRALNGSPFYHKACSGYCSRAFVENENELFAKEFCDILGPEMCNECFKRRKQMLEAAELTHSHPDISVSPYMLCVAQKAETVFGVVDSPSPTLHCGYDALYRRLSVARPTVTTSNVSGLKTRPNSSNETHINWCLDDYSPNPPTSPSLTLPSFGSPSPSPDYSFGWNSARTARNRRTPSKLSVVSTNSRRASITRFINSRNDGITRTQDIEGSFEENETSEKEAFDEDDCMVGAIKGNIVKSAQPKMQHKSSLEPSSSKSKQGSSKSRSAKINRTGKLSELPYWKFLIPEPPQMGLERMNVSIYTPKSIPGIKIFDETLFEI